MVTLKDMPKEELILKGNAACPGCPATVALRIVLKVLGKNTIMTVPACCTAVIQGLYPRTAFNVPLMNIAFEAVGAGASGIKAGLRSQGKDDVNVLAWAGDGGSYDIGIQALSGAAERGTDMIFICYNNQMYSNTGVQRSGATPYGASTTTTWTGKLEHNKDLAEIMMAHHIPYVASACVSYPDDLYAKVEKAKKIKGFKYIEILAPCPPGWRFPMENMIDLGRQAVETGMWALYEVEDDKMTFTGPSKGILDGARERKPVLEYLQGQGRFSHLFKPAPNENALKEIDSYLAKVWDRYRKQAECLK
ncbi:MAG: 2-ketoisovalerate ferredoxin oxidoreductase [Thermoplasmata archaeon HGW-Thermoplasmata-2]|nr:MAG: 2-ketoisovalerate ferredoxin oxidoreductase [Thermoplasmata archaeon HGW-Thermoplasmata-2]